MVQHERNKRGEGLSNSRREYFLGMILTLVASAFWGSTYASIKIDLSYYNPYEITMLRAVLASLGLSVYFLVSKKRVWFIPRDRRILLLLGLASFLGATAFWEMLNLGVFFVDPDTSSFLVALYPLIAVILASAFLKEKMNIAKLAGLILGLLGTFLIVAYGAGARFSGSNPALGEIFSVLAALAWAGYMIVARVLMGRVDKKTGCVIDAEYLTFTTFTWAIIPTFLVSAAAGPISNLFVFSATGLAYILYLGFLTSALAFVIFNIGLRWIGVIKAAVNQLLFPAVAVVVSYALLGELINLEQVAGIALILIGILVAQIVSKRA